MDSGRILLLSDGSQIFSILDQVFTEAGYQTLTTHSPQGAVQALRRGAFQLMITRSQPDRPEPLTMLKLLRQRHPRVAAIILRGEHEVNSPIQAYQVQDDQETFIPCGWPGLRRLVANCLSC